MVSPPKSLHRVRLGFQEMMLDQWITIWGKKSRLIKDVNIFKRNYKTSGNLGMWKVFLGMIPTHTAERFIDFYYINVANFGMAKRFHIQSQNTRM